jgi:hypothetical protein
MWSCSRNSEWGRDSVAVLAGVFDAAHLALLLLDLALALRQANGRGPEVRKTKLLRIPPLIDVTTVFENQTHRGRGSPSLPTRTGKATPTHAGTNQISPSLQFPLFPYHHTFLVKEHTMTFPRHPRYLPITRCQSVALSLRTVSPANAIISHGHASSPVM